MGIGFSILAILAVLITLTLLLPIKIILKNDKQNKFILKIRFLFLTFGVNSKKQTKNTDQSVAIGANRLQFKTVQSNIRDNGLQKTLSDSYAMLTELLREVVTLFKHCTITRLRIKILCGGNDADQVAIHYGQYCAATHSLLNVLGSFLNIRKRGRKIHIGCNFFGESEFRYEIILAFPIRRILVGFGKLAISHFKRAGKKKKSTPK